MSGFWVFVLAIVFVVVILSWLLVRQGHPKTPYPEWPDDDEDIDLSDKKARRGP